MPAVAQDLKTEVVVDRTIETSLPDAKPMKSVSPVFAAGPSQPEALTMAEYDQWGDIPANVLSSNPAAYTGFETPSKYKGYLTAGYCPVYNSAAQAGYRIIDSKKAAVGASVGFSGYSYKTIGEESVKYQMQNNTLGGHVYGSYLIDAKTAVFFTGSGAGAFLKSPYRNNDFTQTIGLADTRVTLSHTGDKFSTDLSAEYNNISYKKAVNPEANPLSENYFNAQATLRYGFSHNSSASMLVGYELLKTGGLPENPLQTLVTLTPLYRWHEGSFSIQGGATVNLAFNTPTKTFHISPRFETEWEFWHKGTLFMECEGGQQFNRIAELYAYNPFAMGEMELAPRYVVADAIAGVKIGSFAGLKLKAFGGWEAVEYAMAMVYEENKPLFIAEGEREKGFYCGGNVEVHSIDALRLTGSARWYPEGSAQLDHAKLMVNAEADIRITRDIKVGIGYSMRTGRIYYGAEEQRTSLGNSYDLHARANYNWRPNISFFIVGENLVNHRHQVVPTLQNQPIHGLLGVNLAF